MFSYANPFMRPCLSSVEEVRENRQPVAKQNAFWQAQEQLSDQIETSLNAYRDVRDHMSEAWFHAIYGSPLMQAFVGLKASDTYLRNKPSTDAAHRALVGSRIEELKEDITKGGPREAVVRAMLYIRIPEGVVDERAFNLLRQMREESGKGLTLSAFKKLVREQFLMLLIDERRAVEAIPELLDRDPDLASRYASDLQHIIEVVGIGGSVSKIRLSEMRHVFERSGAREPSKIVAAGSISALEKAAVRAAKSSKHA
jgi:hypothetical protein